jgi:hypothetical protein
MLDPREGDEVAFNYKGVATKGKVIKRQGMRLRVEVVRVVHARCFPPFPAYRVNVLGRFVYSLRASPMRLYVCSCTRIDRFAICSLNLYFCVFFCLSGFLPLPISFAQAEAAEHTPAGAVWTEVKEITNVVKSGAHHHT